MRLRFFRTGLGHGSQQQLVHECDVAFFCVMADDAGITRITGYPHPILTLLQTASDRLTTPDARAHLDQTLSAVQLELRRRGEQRDAKLIMYGNFGGEAYALAHITSRRALSILSVYVPPAARRTGRGRQMVHSLMRAVNQECKMCTVELQACLVDPTRGFWQQLGFTMCKYGFGMQGTKEICPSSPVTIDLVSSSDDDTAAATDVGDISKLEAVGAPPAAAAPEQQKSPAEPQGMSAKQELSALLRGEEAAEAVEEGSADPHQAGPGHHSNGSDVIEGPERVKKKSSEVDRLQPFSFDRRGAPVGECWKSPSDQKRTRCASFAACPPLTLIVQSLQRDAC